MMANDVYEIALPFVFFLLQLHGRQFLWMHSFAMRVVVAARCECSSAKWTGKLAYARVLDHVIEQRIFQFKRFAANIAAKRFPIGVMHPNVIP